MFLIAIVVLLAADAADVGYIVGMYSTKEHRGLGGHFIMSVNGRKVAKLRYPTYYRLEVPKGVYNVKLDGEKSPGILCHVIAGESCFVRARTVGSDRRREVQLISPEQAAVELGKLLPLEIEAVYVQPKR